MMWFLFIAVVSLGHFPETFTRSLVPSVVMVPLVAFRLNQNNERQLTQDADVYFDNSEHHQLDFQIQKFSFDDAGSLFDNEAISDRDEIEETFVLLKAKTTRQREKRYIQQLSHHMPCYFKICGMGRKKHR